MSAVRARGVCPRGTASKVRYRNRAGARKGLDAARKACREDGLPEPLWPVMGYRCGPRSMGGCAGWHLSGDRRKVYDYLHRAVIPVDVTDLLQPAPAAA